MQAAQPDTELVVLLHGIFRTSLSMSLLGIRLRKAGFVVANLGYPSRRMPLEAIADTLHPKIQQAIAGHGKVHFVAHSMGGLVIRHYLSKHPLPPIGRIVMLGTPNHGSEIADWLRSMKLYHWLYGPAGQQLTTDALHPALEAGEIGIIAGDRSLNPLGIHIFRGSSDGTVSVTSTKLANMKDHITLPRSHSFMPLTKLVSDSVIRFIKTGSFA